MRIPLLLALLGYGVVADPGVLRTNTVTLTWDASEPLEEIQAARVYYRTNLPDGLVLPEGTNRTGSLAWVPPQNQTNQWTYLTSTVGPTNAVTFTNVWSGNNTAVFFVVTASNRIGESFFSNVAWLPKKPEARDRKLIIVLE
jgi:hypothetical protein